MLAGGAPLHAERLAARGGPPLDLRDPLTFYDTSSYGPAAIEAIGRTGRSGQLVYGSDRPVIEPIARPSTTQCCRPTPPGSPPASRPRIAA